MQRLLYDALVDKHKQESEWKVVMKDRLSNEEFDRIRRDGLYIELTRQVASGTKWSCNEARCLIQAATGKYTLATTLIKFGLNITDR